MQCSCTHVFVEPRGAPIDRSTACPGNAAAPQISPTPSSPDDSPKPTSTPGYSCCAAVLSSVWPWDLQQKLELESSEWVCYLVSRNSLSFNVQKARSTAFVWSLSIAINCPIRYKCRVCSIVCWHDIRFCLFTLQLRHAFGAAIWRILHRPWPGDPFLQFYMPCTSCVLASFAYTLRKERGHLMGSRPKCCMDALDAKLEALVESLKPSLEELERQEAAFTKARRSIGRDIMACVCAADANEALATYRSLVLDLTSRAVLWQQLPLAMERVNALQNTRTLTLWS